MKVTYYEIYDNRYDSIPKELENRKFSSFEGAIRALKGCYKPFRNCGENLICDLDELVIYEQETQQVVIDYKKVKGKKEQIPIYESETYTKVVKSYLEYNTNKSGFYSGNTSKDKKGYFITKIGEVQETIDAKESQISWQAPVFVQFWSAERKYSPEVKQEGLPYSPAKSEVINELAISEWLPVYYTPRGFCSRDKYYIDRLSCGQWEVCCDYTLTDSFRISKVEIEIEDTV